MQRKESPVFEFPMAKPETGGDGSGPVITAALASHGRNRHAILGRITNASGVGGGRTQVQHDCESRLHSASG